MSLPIKQRRCTEITGPKKAIGTDAKKIVKSREDGKRERERVIEMQIVEDREDKRVREKTNKYV